MLKLEQSPSTSAMMQSLPITDEGLSRKAHLKICICKADAKRCKETNYANFQDNKMKRDNLLIQVIIPAYCLLSR